MFEGVEIIHAYTRQQALEDGVLVDASDMANQAGIRYPVALTAAVWERCVTIPAGVSCQSEQGRLWDVVYMLRWAIVNSGGGVALDFGVHVRNRNREGIPPLVMLKAVCGPGDHGEPVITVMLPDED